MTPSSEQIEELAAEIGTRFNAERVILFGSHARGTPGPDSDVDLLVVMEHEDSSIDQALRILRALKYRGALDLVVRSPAEVERRTRLGDFFLREVLREGKTLYERPH